jgi:hypothetical protein
MGCHHSRHSPNLRSQLATDNLLRLAAGHTQNKDVQQGGSSQALHCMRLQSQTYVYQPVKVTQLQELVTPQLDDRGTQG